MDQSNSSTFSDSHGCISAFKIITNERTPEAPPFSENTPAWIINNKVLLVDFVCYCKKLKNILGLAANQVEYKGKILNERFFVFKDENGTMEIAVDPKIEEFFPPEEKEIEGCLSWPMRPIIAKRFRKIRGSYYNINGEKVEKIFNQLESQIWQHEIDHLNGVEEIFVKSTEPYRRDGEKIKRNDPCPCKSGKKFKRCCGFDKPKCT